MAKRNEVQVKEILNTTLNNIYITDDYYIDRQCIRIRTFIKCRCLLCGKEFFVNKLRLKSGKIQDCGCTKTVPRRKKRLYHLYYNIKQRCYNPKNNKYYLYGKKGIVMCDEWLNDYSVFEEWAINHGYNETLTIDRKDSNGNYCPENCQWITLSENSAKANYNRCKIHSKLGTLIGIHNNIIYIFNNIARFAREYNLNSSGIRNCILSIGFKNHKYKEWSFYQFNQENIDIICSLTTIENIANKKDISE